MPAAPIKVKKIARYKSRSSDSWYNVWADSSGRAVCTCPGWSYKQTCWHVDRETEKILERGYLITGKTQIKTPTQGEKA